MKFQSLLKWFLLFSPVFAFSSLAANPTTRLTWFGQSAFEIVTPGGQVLMIDPWLSNPLNPSAGKGKDPLKNFKKVDYILITHGHFDHVGDAVALAKKTKARLVTNHELGNNMAVLLGFPKNQMGFDSLMNIGGEISLAGGEVKVFMTPAVHSSGMGRENGELHYGGTPAGFVIKIKDGPSIYHSGDTAYFTDMKLIGDLQAPDVALINIGGHFGMEPDQAVLAAQATKAKLVIPHHYKTFPILTQDPASFVKGVKDAGLEPLVMNPGQTIEFDGKELKK